MALPDGGLYGDNTDYYGFLHMTDSAGIDFRRRKVLILGSGGTSLTASSAVKSRGGMPVIISRHGENNYDNLYLNYDAGAIVNTTPLGMYPDTAVSPVSLHSFNNCRGVVDVIYNPSRTRLLQEADRLNIPHAGGLSMLVAQAKGAGELFIGSKIPDHLIGSITRSLQRDMINLTFIGMPGSGKSSVAAKTAEALNRPFYDLDKIIEERCGKSISDIFAESGEEYFRKLETNILAEFTKKSGCVISTGGGAVLAEENRRNIRQNSFVVHLKRDFRALATKGRPLSRSLNVLRDMERDRLPLYNTCADLTVSNNGHLSDTINTVMEGFYEVFSN